jgi:hypothetical protein
MYSPGIEAGHTTIADIDPFVNDSISIFLLIERYFEIG